MTSTNKPNSTNPACNIPAHRIPTVQPWTAINKEAWNKHDEEGTVEQSIIAPKEKHIEVGLQIPIAKTLGYVKIPTPNQESEVKLTETEIEYNNFASFMAMPPSIQLKLGSLKIKTDMSLATGLEPSSAPIGLKSEPIFISSSLLQEEQDVTRGSRISHPNRITKRSKLTLRSPSTPSYFCTPVSRRLSTDLLDVASIPNFDLFSLSCVSSLHFTMPIQKTIFLKAIDKWIAPKRYAVVTVAILTKEIKEYMLEIQRVNDRKEKLRRGAVERKLAKEKTKLEMTRLVQDAEEREQTCMKQQKELERPFIETTRLIMLKREKYAVKARRLGRRVSMHELARREKREAKVGVNGEGDEMDIDIDIQVEPVELGLDA